MTSQFIQLAEETVAKANSAFAAGLVEESMRLFEMALSAALTDGGAMPFALELRPADRLDRILASTEHVLARVSRHAIHIQAHHDFVGRQACHLRRLSTVGTFLARLAQSLSDDALYEIVADLGDGHDSGDYPRLAYSSSRPDAVLIPDPLLQLNDDYAVHRAYAQQCAKPWAERHEIAFWRGGSTGPHLYAPQPQSPVAWDWQQRLHLCATAHTSRHAGRLDVGLSHRWTISEPFWQAEIDAADFVCGAVPKIRFLDYRYLFDIDGWTNAWSLLDKLIGGATMLKVDSAFGYRQWYYHRLEPWVNYVPIASDLSDFDEVLDWVFAHPAECGAIAAAGAALGAEIHLEPSLADAVARALPVLRRL